MGAPEGCRQHGHLWAQLEETTLLALGQQLLSYARMGLENSLDERLLVLMACVILWAVFTCT